MATTEHLTATPLRTCIGCRRRRPQSELVRCVAGDPRAQVSRSAAGRGAWLCSLECFHQAERRRAFDRAWKCRVPAAMLEDLGRELQSAFGAVVIMMEESLDVGGAADERAPEKG